jgi:glutamine synthetase
LEILLHEKPFRAMNGSGKHNNWSIGGGGRGNLLEPGTTPESNLEFLVFLVCVICAVNKRAGLLRASIACLGNDSRLGGHEAPPSIMSVYLGEYLDSVLNSIEVLFFMFFFCILILSKFKVVNTKW